MQVACRATWLCHSKYFTYILTYVCIYSQREVDVERFAMQSFVSIIHSAIFKPIRLRLVPEDALWTYITDRRIPSPAALHAYNTEFPALVDQVPCAPDAHAALPKTCRGRPTDVTSSNYLAHPSRGRTTGGGRRYNCVRQWGGISRARASAPSGGRRRRRVFHQNTASSLASGC